MTCRPYARTTSRLNDSELPAVPAADDDAYDQNAICRRPDPLLCYCTRWAVTGENYDKRNTAQQQRG